MSAPEWDHQLVALGHRDASPAPPRPARPFHRIAVLLEPGRRGTMALDRAVALAREHEAQLIVVAQAPQARGLRCCGEAPPDDYNHSVCAAVLGSLAGAARRLGAGEPAVRYELLVEEQDPPLARWVAERELALVLLPARWPVLGHPRHPEARRLRRESSAEVRIVS